MVACLCVLTPCLGLCLIIEEFEIVGSLIPLAVVFVLSWTGCNCLFWLRLEPFVCFFPSVGTSGVLLRWLLELLEPKIDVAFLVDVGSRSNLKRGYQRTVRDQITYFYARHRGVWVME